MEPSLKAGQTVWVYHWAYLFQQPKIAEIIVFKFHSQYFVKRIKFVSKNRVTVIGDNPTDSLDSQDFGEIGFEQIIGKVL